jgi:hypothetical protein
MKYTKFCILFLSLLATFSFTSCLSDAPKINKEKVALKSLPNKDSLIKKGMPERISSQYLKVLSNKKYNGKSFFIIDTRENLIFFFDKNGSFVAKSPTIDGFVRQSKDKEKIKIAFKKWSEHASDIGFEWDFDKKKYVDTRKTKREYKHALVYQEIYRSGGCFFPKGIYTIPSVFHSKQFVGAGNNTYDVKNSENKDLSLAIHGLYQSEYRIKTMKNMLLLIKTDFKEIAVPKSYRDQIVNNINNNIYNNSYGCINVPEGFIKLTEKQAVGALIFVIGEEKENYLIES